ncbi:NAD(P)-binding protein [Cadophora sp. DSE1049]|nr:NAD(P)-binding protein [Cadophora sp. DSE1049]
MPSFIIVGASRGLGFAWLQYLSKDPRNTVIGLVRTTAVVEERLVKEGISNVHILHGDMSDHQSLTNAASSASSILPDGALDIIIVNGYTAMNETLKIPPSGFASQPDLLHKDMHASLDVNAIGVVNSMNAFLPLILRGRAKKIIVISTGGADPDLAVAMGIPFQFTICVMKAALNMVVAKFAAELKSQDVKVLALSPGVVSTAEAAHWPGPMTPLESVEHQMKVIEDLTIEDTGRFLSHWGNKQWL